MKKYRIILIPQMDAWEEFYKITESLSEISDGYLMSSNSSVPHITLSKFEAEDKAVEKIWNSCRMTVVPNVEFYGLTFAKRKVNWALVLTKRTEIVPFQKKVYEILNTHNLKLDEIIRESYIPHLTLIRTPLSELEIIKKLGDFSFLFEKKLKWNLVIARSGKYGKIKEKDIVYST
ncbi:MAG: hypothetical protein ACTSXL_04760 [Alphaproteobacteria bacterium]